MAPGNQSRAKHDANGQLVKPGRQPNEDDLAGLERMRPYEAFVWSSAQPDNVWSMVNASFGEHGDSIRPQKAIREKAYRALADTPPQDRPGRLLGVWDRTSLGLSSADFGQYGLARPHETDPD
jgi:hypothetical protein